MTSDEWLKYHERYEKYAMPIFRKALRTSYQPVLNNIQVINYDNYKALIAFFVQSTPINEAYVKVYSRVGLVHGKRIGNQINRDIKDFVKDIYESDFLKAIYGWVQTNLGQRITEVNNYTIELIQRIVATSLDRNYSVSQMRVYLEKQLNSPSFNRMRSLRIARTETTTAANYGAYVAAENSKLVMDKEWLSVIDDRTRHSHLLENGQTVGQYESFIMSDNSELLFPGDATAPASQVVNCRCTYNLIPRRDSEGMLIFRN